jgi:4-amino-4-deoxy-L-arabinose transferase-like glycosyltransferase
MSAETNHRRRAWRGALLVFVVALIPRLIYLAEIKHSPYYDPRLMQGTDCSRYYEWAGQIAAGDLIGQGQFDQAPLYPYLLAAALRLSGNAFLIVPRLLQSLMGALTPVLVFLIGSRLVNRRAGILGGLLAALYGPLIFYDGAWLSAGLLAFLYTALVLAMFASQERPGFWRGLACGLLFGLGILGKQHIAVMLAVAPWWLWEARRAEQKVAATPAGNSRLGRGWLKLLAGAAAGCALVLSLLAARNLAAGAPPFIVSQRGAFEFLVGNLPGSPPSGWTLNQPALEMRVQADRKLFRAVGLVLEFYRDRPGDLVRRQAEKARAYLDGFEPPNNVSLYVEREYVPLFKFPLVSWPAILGLGLVGAWFCRRQWRRAVTLYGYVLLYSLGVIAFYILARFRLPVVPVLAAFAGAGLEGMVTRVRDGRWKGAVIGATAALLIALAVWPRVEDPFRTGDYYNLVVYHLRQGEPYQARKWIARGRQNVETQARKGESGEVRYDRAYFMFIAGEPLEAVEAELARAGAGANPEWLQREIEILTAECRQRKSNGDPKLQDFRLLSS